jgi:hypothetical protein
MASRQTFPARSPKFYPDPWAQRPDPPPVDRLVLATARADQLAALLATRLEDRSVGETSDDLPDATRLELGALGLTGTRSRRSAGRRSRFTRDHRLRTTKVDWNRTFPRGRDRARRSAPLERAVWGASRRGMTDRRGRDSE